jgi:hypothetical protein
MAHWSAYACPNLRCSGYRREVHHDGACARCGWELLLACLWTWRPGA